MRVHSHDKSIFMHDYEGPYKRLMQFDKKSNIKLVIPFAKFNFDVNADYFEEIKRAMKCKEFDEDLFRCSALDHGFFVYLQEGHRPLVRLLPDFYNPNITELIEFKDKLLSSNPNLKPVDGVFALYGNKSLGYISISINDDSSVIDIVPSKYIASKRFWESKLFQKKTNKPDFLKLD